MSSQYLEISTASFSFCKKEGELSNPRIVKPEALMAQFLSMKLINWIFVILTLVKAYYITWDFMHMRDEKFGLQVSVVITLIFLIGYAAFIFLVEGNYIYDIMYEGFVSWNF